MISPAAIDTPMLKAGFAENPQGLDALRSYHPSGTVGDPSEVAHWVSSLLTSDGRFQMVWSPSLDGGISARLHDPG